MLFITSKNNDEEITFHKRLSIIGYDSVFSQKRYLQEIIRIIKEMTKEKGVTKQLTSNNNFAGSVKLAISSKKI